MSIFKGPDSDIDLQYNSEERVWSCYECDFMGGRGKFESKVHREAFDHVVAHIEAGHMVPPGAVDYVRRWMDKGTVIHSGLHAKRIHSSFGSAQRERKLAMDWLRECKNVRTLDFLLEEDLGDVTQRDATIAATVVQWLGSNCGLSFLTGALEKCGYKITKDDAP